MDLSKFYGTGEKTPIETGYTYIVLGSPIWWVGKLKEEER